ncbi:MAG: MlaE family lipid ABC transporter permease subunit [Planctomycetes bacterium]|nr:MlaE family lipid ABC transporter permease subunit [Planctomycetota bacterium]
MSSPTAATATLRAVTAADGTTTIAIDGRLDASSTGRLWREAEAALGGRAIPQLTVDASAVSWCDGSGIALLFHLRERQRAAGGTFEVKGLSEALERQLAHFPPGALDVKPRAIETPGFVEQVGRGAAGVLKDLVAQVAFTGELAATLAQAALHPRQVRWKDTWRVAERAGVNAFPIIALVGFLIGLILAFQAAIPMKQFGAEIFVADLVALSVIRELGPLMTAIVLAGRSGSAFAAEIGTMRVNEEINALTTMGLTPVRFLVVPRVLAAVAVTPLLTAFTNFFGLVGGLVVMWSLGFPTVTYVNEVRGALRGFDLPGGLIKSLAFGLLVAGIGCLRGLQTGTGASAVGESTTRAVVAGIVLIILSDGLFSVVFYYLGI